MLGTARVARLGEVSPAKACLLLSLPMVVLGIIGFIYFGKRGKAA